MSYIDRNAVLISSVKELSFDEICLVGAAGLGDIIGAISTAVCDLVTKGSKTVQCAAAGAAIGVAVNDPKPAPGPAIFPY